MKSAALYLRVSTGEQSCANQLPGLRKLARARGFKIVTTYEEQVSATKVRDRYDAMMRAAHEGAFDVLMIWALDRLGRSLVSNVAAVLELDRLGVEVVSLREPWLDSGGPVRSLLVAIFSWVAEQERARLVERTKAGIDRARTKGKRLGRPRTRVDVDRAVAMIEDEGISARAVARRLGVASTTLHRAIAARSLETVVKKPAAVDEAKWVKIADWIPDPKREGRELAEGKRRHAALVKRTKDEVRGG